MGSRLGLFHFVFALQLLVRLHFNRAARACGVMMAVFAVGYAPLNAQPSASIAVRPHIEKELPSSQENFVEVFRLGGQSGEIVIAGRATNRLPAEMTQVQVAFQSETGAVAIPLPVKRVISDSSKRTRYEFETVVCGLPQIAPGDPRHAKPFFAILVADRNGNRYYQEESYAQFISPGENAVPLQRVVELPPQSLLARAPATARKTPQKNARTTQPAFTLKAVRQGAHACRLEWADLPKAAAAAHTPSVILRNEQHVAITFANHYIDNHLSLNSNLKYRVEQTGRDGLVYSSNTCEVTPNYSGAKLDRSTLDSGGLIAAGAYIERTPEALAAVVSKHNAAIQHCFQRELKHNSALRGEVRVRIVVNARGSVDSVNVISSTLKSPGVEDCMVSRIKRWNDFGPGDPRKAAVAIKQTYVFGY